MHGLHLEISIWLIGEGGREGLNCIMTWFFMKMENLSGAMDEHAEWINDSYLQYIKRLIYKIDVSQILEIF